MDRDALSMAFTLEGEHASQANAMRREAQKLRVQANGLDEQAKAHDERAGWAKALADAFSAQMPAEGRKGQS